MLKGALTQSQCSFKCDYDFKMGQSEYTDASFWYVMLNVYALLLFNSKILRIQ